MSWTKRQIIEEAFGELALAGYDFDLQPEELQFALRRLDTMMATWSSLGISIGYSMSPDQDGSSLDDASGIAAFATEAAFMNLACKIAAGKGKSLPQSTKTNAKQAYDALILTLAKNQVQEQQYAAGTPLGQGRKPWRNVNPFVPAPNRGPLQTGIDGGLDFNGLGN